jgi:hypothetical protein
MILRIFRLAMLLLVILLMVWFVHKSLFLTNLVEPISLMTPAYLVNYFLATAIFAAVIMVHRSHSMMAGYVFLGGSMLKFLVFFLFFYPTFTVDDELSRVEFSVFFGPYIVTLSTTVVASVRVLNTV